MAANILPVLRPAAHLPLYYISFHGAYTQETLHAPPPTLPKNCFMFETGDPGEFVNTDIDNYLWPLCAYEARERLLGILSSHNSEETTTPFEDAARSMRIILPETQYMRRRLAPHAGRGGRAFLQGIFKQRVGDPFNPRLPMNRDTLCKDYIKTLTECGWRTTNEDVIRLILASDPDAADGAIFVVVSCAVIDKLLSSKDVEVLENFQRNKDLEFWHAADYKRLEGADNIYSFSCSIL